jgi:hypothetical protein
MVAIEQILEPPAVRHRCDGLVAPPPVGDARKRSVDREIGAHIRVIRPGPGNRSRMSQFEQENDLGRGGGEVDDETMEQAKHDAEERLGENEPDED